MNELKVVAMNGRLVTESREVAKMVGKDHADLLKDVRGYARILGEGKVAVSDFFIESTYQSAQKKTLPCFQLTKKGCDLVANKMTGTKGVLFTATYINRFEEMENQLKQKNAPSYMIESPIERAKAWINEEEEREKLRLIVEIQTPKVSYYDEILNSIGTYTTTQIADDYDTSAQKMNNALHLMEVQYKTNGQWGLYIQHKGKGYVETKTSLVIGVPRTTMVWTTKGRVFIYETLKSNGYLPNAEKDKAA